MEKMTNTLQHYAWGSKDALTRLYGITDPDGRSMAKLWIGAHPKNSSRVLDPQGNEIALRTLITRDPQGMLGEATMDGDGRQCTLQTGESVFIAAKNSPITVSGSGRLTRVYNQSE